VGFFIFICMKYLITEQQFKRINYSELNPKEQEDYNFAKISSKLADYGYRTIRDFNDWGGADFYCIDRGCDLGEALKVQQKGRLTFDKKYIGKNLYIAFEYKPTNTLYIYLHDELLNKLILVTNIENTSSWMDKGKYTFKSISKPILDILNQYKLD
jgi:hypothetical protein